MHGSKGDQHREVQHDGPEAPKACPRIARLASIRTHNNTRGIGAPTEAVHNLWVPSSFWLWAWAGPARGCSDFSSKCAHDGGKSSFPHRKRLLACGNQRTSDGPCLRPPKNRCRWPQPAAVARCLGSQWAAGGWIPSYQQRSAGAGSLSSLHTAAQQSCQLFAPFSCARTWRVGFAATVSAMALRKAVYRNGASEACRPPCDDPVIVRWMRLCVSLGSVCENGVIVYVDYIFDCPGPFVRIDKPILHLDAYGRRLLTLPDTFAICWLALPVPRAPTPRNAEPATHQRRG